MAQSRAGHLGPQPHEFADFERIYQGAQPGRPMGGGLPAGPIAGLPGLTPSLHVRPPQPVHHLRRAARYTQGILGLALYIVVLIWPMYGLKHIPSLGAGTLEMLSRSRACHTYHELNTLRGVTQISTWVRACWLCYHGMHASTTNVAAGIPRQCQNPGRLPAPASAPAAADAAGSVPDQRPQHHHGAPLVC